MQPQQGKKELQTRDTEAGRKCFAHQTPMILQSFEPSKAAPGPDTKRSIPELRTSLVLNNVSDMGWKAQNLLRSGLCDCPVSDGKWSTAF